MRNLTLQRHARRLRNDATDAERRLWSYLRARQLAGFRFRRQMPLGQYIVDFACIEAKLVVEVDGGQHQESERDAIRDAQMDKGGFKVLRFWNNQVLGETQAVLTRILQALEQSVVQSTSGKDASS
jgi:very-short-patch-repair endonuclease